MATHKETRMPPRRTRVVGTGPDNGYGYTGQYLAQYYDREMKVWFDIGDPHDTEQEALAAAKASEQQAALRPSGSHLAVVTSEALALRLADVVARPRNWSRADRDDLILEAALRLYGESHDKDLAAAWREHFGQ